MQRLVPTWSTLPARRPGPLSRGPSIGQTGAMVDDFPGPIEDRPKRDPRSLTRRQRKALVFVPLVLVVAVVVLLLGIPWQVVAAALALFVLWLVIEG